jgi:aminopeptidase
MTEIVLVSRAVHEDLNRRLAELIVEVGANVQEGQIVGINADPAAAPVVHELAKACYRRGVRFVDVFYFDPEIKRIRLEHAGEDTLDFVPPWYAQRLLGLGEHKSARIALHPVVPPGTLDGIDPARAGRDQLPSLKEGFQVINAASTNWCVGPSPTEGWAKIVFPELEPSEALERLWEDLVHVLRLDEPDPAGAWKERFATLAEVGGRLTEQRFDALHFEGPGTDLTVGLLPGSIFEGGSHTTAWGLEYGANLPTEEVTSAPDPLRADGVVAATKPLDVGGSVVEGLRVRFEGGRAVQIDADANAEALRARCAGDDGAARLGEVALVDREGRIGPLGRTFFNTLLDENAASHLAFGNAYDSCVDDEESKARLNRSGIHLDFMIGSNEVAVTGITRDGDRVPVLRDGSWQL